MGYPAPKLISVSCFPKVGLCVALRFGRQRPNRYDVWVITWSSTVKRTDGSRGDL